VGAVAIPIEQAASLATEFLGNYIEENDFFTPEDELDEADPDDAGAMRLNFLDAQPMTDKPGSIQYNFEYGRELDEDSPELGKNIEKCMKALFKAHPQVERYPQVLYVTSSED
jgi:hypothetical protein